MGVLTKYIVLTLPVPTTNIHILITDHLNSIESMLDFKTGNTISSTTYNSFGSQSKSLDSNSNRSYTNHQYDKENNLLYMNARYQIPKQGQFISSDNNVANNVKSLLANPQDLNAYSYVRNNPIHYTDPSGNCLEDLCVAEAAALGALNGAIVSVAAQGVIDLYNGNLSTFETYRNEALVGGSIGAASLGLGAWYKGGARVVAEVGKPVLQKGILLSEQMGNRSFESFAALKKAVKKEFQIPGDIDLHHIVEQGGLNAKNFSQEILQSTDNIMPIARSTHRKITGFYNSNSLITGAKQRLEISAKDFNTQYETGLKVMKNIMKQ